MQYAMFSHDHSQIPLLYARLPHSRLRRFLHRVFGDLCEVDSFAGCDFGLLPIGDLDAGVVDSVSHAPIEPRADQPARIRISVVRRAVVRARRVGLANVIAVCFSSQCDAVGQHVNDPRRIGRVADLPREIAPQILARLVRRLCRRAAGLECRPAQRAINSGRG